MNKCDLCGENVNIPDAKKCNRCWELNTKLESLISQHPKIAYDFLLDNAGEIYKKMKGTQ